MMLKKIPKLTQRQDSLLDQLQDLILVANRLGMYDAADLVMEFTKKAQNKKQPK